MIKGPTRPKTGDATICRGRRKWSMRVLKLEPKKKTSRHQVSNACKNVLFEYRMKEISSFFGIRLSADSEPNSSKLTMTCNLAIRPNRVCPTWWYPRHHPWKADSLPAQEIGLEFWWISTPRCHHAKPVPVELWGSMTQQQQQQPIDEDETRRDCRLQRLWSHAGQWAACWASSYRTAMSPNRPQLPKN